MADFLITQMERTERAGEKWWRITATGPNRTVSVGHGVYAPDGVILDVVSVSKAGLTPEQLGGNDDLVSIVAEKRVSEMPHGDPVGGKWKVLRGGEGAQPRPDNVGSLIEGATSLWEDIPLWVKLAGGGFLGLLAYRAVKP